VGGGEKNKQKIKKKKAPACTNGRVLYYQRKIMNEPKKL